MTRKKSIGHERHGVSHINIVASKDGASTTRAQSPGRTRAASIHYRIQFHGAHSRLVLTGPVSTSRRSSRDKASRGHSRALSTSRTFTRQGIVRASPYHTCRAKSSIRQSSRLVHSHDAERPTQTFVNLDYRVTSLFPLHEHTALHVFQITQHRLLN